MTASTSTGALPLAPTRRAVLAPGAAPSAPAGSGSAPAGSATSPVTGDAPSAAAPVRPRRDPVRLAVRLAPLLGLAASIAMVVWGLESGVLRSLEALQAFIDSLGAWGPIVFLLASAASVVFPVVPAGLLVIAGPVLFGPVEGTIYNYLAVCAGSLLNFLIARHVGLAFVERMVRPETVEKFLGWTRSDRFTRAFAVAIALPVAPDDLLCYIAGTTRMTWRTFVLIILLCKPWALIAYGLGISAILLHLLPW